jgi:hypothetical protein
LKYILRNQNRRSKDTSPHVSLFPFLAVLICTMGALVPVLFSVSRQARAQASIAAAAKDEEIKADVKAEREMVEWRIEQMQTSRKKTEAEIETARLELGHLEDHSRRLKSKIAELEKTIGEIDRSGAGDGQRRAATSADLEELRKQITEAEKQLAEAKVRAAGKKRSFAIVPYEGPNSTHRRPIYIECRENCVVLQPEGVVLNVHDFEGPMGPSNPLAAALRAEREYLLSQNGFDQQRDGEPYPLLLVRPDGIIAYYAARAAMKSWGPEFGYEFVDDDWKLAYQPPDPQMGQVVNKAVESARVVQERLIAAAPRQYSQKRPSSASRGSPGPGGSGYGSGSGASGVAGGSSRGSAGSGSQGGNGPGFGGGGQGSGGNGDSWDENTNRKMPGEPDPFLAGVNNPYTSLTVGGSGAGGAGAAGAQGTGPGYGGGPGAGNAALGPALGNPNGSGVAGSGGMGLTGNGTGGGGGGIGSSGNTTGVAGGAYPQGGAPGFGTGTSAGGSGSQGNPGGGYSGAGGMAGGPTGTQAGNGGQGGFAANGNGSAAQSNIASNGNNSAVRGNFAANGNGAARQGTLSSAGQGATGGRSSPGGQTASGGNSDPQGQGGVLEQSKQPPEPPDIFASRVAAANAAKNGTENRTNTAPSSSMGGQVAPPLHPGEWRERPPEPPPQPVVEQKAPKKRNMDKYRSQDWGLKDSGPGSVPITRPVLLECQADRLMLMPDRGRGGNAVAVMASGTDSTVDDLVSAIWERMNGWGMAGRGMYWRPVLRVHVAPGGEQRFSDLQTLLEGSGLDIVKQ